ncbi:MAG: ACP S-malonyltransferase [Bacteroidetes bacterium]|nr:ACP S-malonyltransferase [Bacteroidota bacterium]
MTLKTIMFPGQGSQYAGMGGALFTEFADIVAKANTVLGYNVAEICLHNPDNKLNLTSYTQPALYVVNYLHLQKHLQEHKTPDYYIGHSLGEFNALNAAGVFDFETGLKIVQKRGELMFSIPGTGMAAIVGAEYKEVKEILQQHFTDIDIANVNTPAQLVISGPLTSLDKAADVFEEEGFVYIPLKVSGAFHSRYMTSVKIQFEQFISQTKVNACKIPVLSNYTASPYPDDAQGILKNMANQLDNRVKWLQSIEYLTYQGECDFVEIGPGEVLTNILKKIKS